ncbi:hypothetical protein [Moorena producens]|nr:hypothetical protein [Moorena producens]
MIIYCLLSVASCLSRRDSVYDSNRSAIVRLAYGLSFRAYAIAF